MKCSFFKPIIIKLWLADLVLTDEWYKEAIFVAINFFMVLVMVKCNQLQYTNFPPEQLRRHKILIVEFPKSKQRQTAKSQKLGTKT